MTTCEWPFYGPNCEKWVFDTHLSFISWDTACHIMHVMSVLLIIHVVRLGIYLLRVPPTRAQWCCAIGYVAVFLLRIWHTFSDCVCRAKSQAYTFFEFRALPEFNVAMHFVLIHHLTNMAKQPPMLLRIGPWRVPWAYVGGVAIFWVDLCLQLGTVDPVVHAKLQFTKSWLFQFLASLILLERGNMVNKVLTGDKKILSGRFRAEREAMLRSIRALAFITGLTTLLGPPFFLSCMIYLNQLVRDPNPSEQVLALATLGLVFADRLFEHFVAGTLSGVLLRPIELGESRKD